MPRTKKTTQEKKDSIAIIETGGKQYLVKPGQKIKVEKLPDVKEGSAIIFDKVLVMANGDSVKIGAPYLKDAGISATFVADVRDRKITMLRYKSKTRRSRKKGHRQTRAEVVIGDF